nr:MAG: Prophage endopeptidase tail [Bacteriophage sp.]
MRKLSNRWKEKVKNGMDVQYLKYADITLTDGTVLNLTSANLWQNGMEFEDSVSNDSSFDIGSAIINVLNLSINNFDGEYSDYDFEGAEVICYVGLQIENEDTSELLDSAGEQILDSTGDTIIVHKNAVIEKARICTVTVIEQPEDETVTIDLTCEDNMRKFDRNYSDSKLKYPATRGQIVRDACEVCGVTLQTTSFDRDDYIVQNRPNDEALTFRQVLQWVAQIGCQWMRCDEYGRLCINWYGSVNEEELTVDELGVLKTQDGSNVNLNFSNSDGALSADNGTLLENDGILRLFATDEKGNISEIETTYGFTPHHTDVVITGVKVTEYSESSSDNPQTYMVGTEGYVLGISGNKLIRVGDGQTIASMIAEKCVGMRFRPFESECPTDVALEAGDSLIIVDRNGKIYTSLLTTTTLKPGSGQKIACNAKSAAKNSSTRYSQATQAFVAARNMVKQEKTAREKALEEFGKRIDSATGVYTTVEPQENGSKIFYLHDKPTLAESQAIWKMTSEAWGVSTDGGQTWNGGMTVDGDTIVRILNAVGVNADWINAGAIMVKDSDGNILFSVDMDTKKVIISGDSVVIGGKTATKALSDNLQESKDYSDGKLADYADTVTGSLAGLQAQIDGQIESFFYDYEPSLQNKPASEWTSTEERKKHEGDLFYWKSTGYAYRFMQDGATWKWQMIQDNDISKALAQAEKAQDTADGKRRTFVIQPSPPYDIGDLWSQDGGDILTCVVARAKGSVYASSDWKKLNKYTDDTTANKALEAAALAKNMTFQLSNEMQTITADADGNIAVFPQVSTKATVMYGSSDITDDCSYTITKSDSITGSWSDATHIYNVTGLSADNGWVDIKATYLINLSITKRFTISKQKSGKNGKQLYTWRKYASMPDGSDMSDSPDYVKLLDSAESPILDSTGDEIYTVTEAIYVGIADNKTTETPSDNPKDYIWSRFRGEDGADGIGIPGENGETSYIHTAYANSIDGTVDFSTTDTDRIYIGHYSDFEKTDSADPAKYTWARMRGEDGPPGRTYYLRANAGVLMMGQDKRITPNPFKVHAYYRDGQGDEATFKTWWVVEYSKDSGKTWTKLAFNVQTSGITINPDSYSLGADGMIRATIYTDSGRTKIADQQTWQVAVDVGMLTQEQIVEILSNDGEFKGLYYLNGHLYISLDALMGNAAILGGTKNGNGYLKIKDKKGTVKGLIDYSGYTAFTSYEENSTRMKYTGICFSDTGINPVSAEKYFSSTADIEYVETAWGIDWTAEELNISATEVSADTGTFGDLTVTNSASFTKSPKIEDMEYTTSSNTICWDGRTGYKQLMLKSSSSKRYKDIGNDISEQEIEEWYNIKPLWAKYKEGYLVKGDENEGRYIPMFIAENVEAFFPEATRHQNGLVEDWNERIMIPAMFAMIKSQKEQLDRQEKLINQLYEKLNIEKEN